MQRQSYAAICCFSLKREISAGMLRLPVDLKVDNEDCRMLLDSDTNSKRAKHIDIRVYFIRDWVRKSVIFPPEGRGLTTTL